jgi:hypothetical protein
MECPAVTLPETRRGQLGSRVPEISNLWHRMIGLYGAVSEPERVQHVLRDLGPRHPHRLGGSIVMVFALWSSDLYHVTVFHAGCEQLLGSLSTSDLTRGKRRNGFSYVSSQVMARLCCFAMRGATFFSQIDSFFPIILSISDSVPDLQGCLFCDISHATCKSGQAFEIIGLPGAAPTIEKRIARYRRGLFQYDLRASAVLGPQQRFPSQSGK